MNPSINPTANPSGNANPTVAWVDPNMAEQQSQNTIFTNLNTIVTLFVAVIIMSLLGMLMAAIAFIGSWGKRPKLKFKF